MIRNQFFTPFNDKTKPIAGAIYVLKSASSGLYYHIKIISDPVEIMGIVCYITMLDCVGRISISEPSSEGIFVVLPKSMWKEGMFKLISTTNEKYEYYLKSLDGKIIDTNNRIITKAEQEKNHKTVIPCEITTNLGLSKLIK